MCYISWWNKQGDSYEFYLNYITYTDLSEVVGFSRKFIAKQLSGCCYRLKNDDMGNRHLYFNSPNSNFIKIPVEKVEILKDKDEMLIRVYILFDSYSDDVIYGLTNKKILSEIGYSATSKNNEVKLSNIIKQLEYMGLIKREIKFNGNNRYSIYYKN